MLVRLAPVEMLGHYDSCRPGALCCAHDLLCRAFLLKCLECMHGVGEGIQAYTLCPSMQDVEFQQCAQGIQSMMSDHRMPEPVKEEREFWILQISYNAFAHFCWSVFMQALHWTLLLRCSKRGRGCPSTNALPALNPLRNTMSHYR